MSFQWAFHLALVIDSLNEGKFTPGWRQRVVGAFLDFKHEVASAQLHYRETHESRPHHERFGRLMSGSGFDTADVIRVRHAFLLGELYPNLRLQPLDPHRLYDPLEKEVIWNRDRGICQNPACQRSERKVPFREATVHHVVEHTAGGQTILENGVLICPECHTDRAGLQRLAAQLQEYLRRIYAEPGEPPLAGVLSSPGTGQSVDDGDENGTRATAAKLKIVINWGLLDVDRETQTLSGGPASDLIVKLLLELIGAFGQPIEQQLTELPVIRYPLSKDPATAFVNPATGVPFSSIHLPGLRPALLRNIKHAREAAAINRIILSTNTPRRKEFPRGKYRMLDRIGVILT